MHSSVFKHNFEWHVEIFPIPLRTQNFKSYTVEFPTLVKRSCVISMQLLKRTLHSNVCSRVFRRREQSQAFICICNEQRLLVLSSSIAAGGGPPMRKFANRTETLQSNRRALYMLISHACFHKCMILFLKRKLRRILTK